MGTYNQRKSSKGEEPKIILCIPSPWERARFTSPANRTVALSRRMKGGLCFSSPLEACYRLGRLCFVSLLFPCRQVIVGNTANLQTQWVMNLLFPVFHNLLFKSEKMVDPRLAPIVGTHWTTEVCPLMRRWHTFVISTKGEIPYTENILYKGLSLHSRWQHTQIVVDPELNSGWQNYLKT